MKTRYSPSTGTSYPFDIDYPNGFPSDLIEVTLTEYESLMAARAAGNNADFVSGVLIITAPTPAPFSVSSAAFLVEVRATREMILNRLAGMGMAALVMGDGESSEAVLNARQALLDLTQNENVLAAMEAENIDALKLAVKNVYKAIVASVPEHIRNAFNQVGA